MLNTTDIGELGKFLSDSGKETLSRLQGGEEIFAVGETLGLWRIEAFLGRGGNGEVYRVVHSVSQISAAAKVLIRTDDAAKRRFRNEIDCLIENRLPQFPRFFGCGEEKGRLYFILELLEPVDVPTDEKNIAAYLLQVCSCVRALHLSGIVHRDLKPKNVMRRPGGQMVLIDFGLAKAPFFAARPRTDISIVDGNVIAAGTPDYAAPEQLTGGEVSQAADIHALGRLANIAFGGNPPHSWAAIIRRATSSIPSQRYDTVDAFARAIRHRNRAKHCLIGCLAVALLSGGLGLYVRPIVRERQLWNSICETVNPEFQTDERGCAMVRLNNGHYVFKRPLVLEDNHDYWLLGPGILDASIQSKGSNTVIHLGACLILNRSEIPYEQAGIRYDFRMETYLNFTNQKKPESFPDSHFMGTEEYEVRFQGPETLREVRALMKQAGKDFF